MFCKRLKGKNQFLIVIVMLFTLQALGAHQAVDVSTSKYKNDPVLSEEFMDWGLGMFVHWSMDSQLGSVISHSMVGASEDYLDRFINELPKTFNPQDYDPEKWMQIASLAGVNYMVLTTKHHSGFCLWDTKTTDFSITNTPYKKDIVRDYVKACRKYGLKVGFYFSPEDFYFMQKQGHLVKRSGDHSKISVDKELLEYDKKQMKELLTKYGKIDVVFLDSFDNEPIREYVHELQPECLVTRGEMATPEQKIPDAPIPGPWESCFTLGNQWQYKPTNEQYKSATKLIEMLIDIRAKGGNLLINVGPDPDGVIPFEQERRFRELALWMFINSEAIHGIRPCDVTHEGDIYFTKSKDGKAVYAFLTNQTKWKLGERREFELKNIRAADNTAISVLGQNSKVVEYQTDIDPASRFEQKGDVLEISVVRSQRIYNNRSWHNPIVVKLENVTFNK